MNPITTTAKVRRIINAISLTIPKSMLLDFVLVGVMRFMLLLSESGSLVDRATFKVGSGVAIFDGPGDGVLGVGVMIFGAWHWEFDGKMPSRNKPTMIIINNFVDTFFLRDLIS